MLHIQNRQFPIGIRSRLHLSRKQFPYFWIEIAWMLSCKGCWVCPPAEAEGGWKQTSVAAGDKRPRCHQAIPSAFAAQRSTGCPQAGDWGIRVSTGSTVKCICFKFKSMEAGVSSELMGVTGGSAWIPNHAFLYIILYSLTNQPTNKIPKKKKYILTLYDCSFETKRSENPLTWNAN